MKYLFLSIAMGLVLSNVALPSIAITTNDRAHMEDLGMEDLEEIYTFDDMGPEDEYYIPQPCAPGADCREKRASVNVPADTSTSKRNLFNERSAGRYCGELSGELIKAEVRAINEKWLLLRNLYWDVSLNDIKVLRFKTTYKNGGTVDSFIRLDPLVHKRPHQFMYYVKYANRQGIILEHLEVFNRDNMVLLASANMSNCVPPGRVLLGQLTETSRGVSSGDIHLLSANAMSIQDILLPTDRYNLHLWAGYGRVEEKNGYIIPVDGSTEPIKLYRTEMVDIQLPTHHTFYDVDYFAVVTHNTYESLGHVYLNRRLWRSDLLPPIWADTMVPVQQQPI